MKYKTEIIVIFLLGLIAGISITIIRSQNPSGSISSRLPDLIFPHTPPLTIVFTGDVMLGRSVNTRIQKYADPTWPFKNISSLLQNADITIINLESPFLDGCRPTDSGMLFCADPDNVSGLVLSGIDIATLANNHIANQGQKGIDQTISLLEKNNIMPVISGKTFINSIKNTKLAILAFSDLPQMNENEMVAQILEATKSADFVITTFHWGNEYQSKPNSRQIYIAHLAVDSGADIVVGHHPHWIQTEELYKGKPIYYSLGNLIFDQMWSEETRLGEILKITYQDKSIIKKEIYPIKIYDFGQPVILPTSQ